MRKEGYTFMGQPPSYWAELEGTVRRGGTDKLDLIQENARLRAKVSYYEELLDRMIAYRSSLV